MTIHDYKYLKGDIEYWAVPGAALWTVREWCHNKRYGDFGKPTELGKAAMKDYEKYSADG